MIDLIKQIEAIPDDYPTVPWGLSTEAAALDSDMIWARIEAYTAHRYTPREIVWTVEGAGDWTPPIIPVNTITAEVWESGQWSDTTLQAGPYGFCLIGDGPYRITADVGGGDVPAPVSGAFTRLAEYMADDPGRVGSSSFTDKIGPLDESVTRTPTWLARAMQYSGAGDLLRPYRRA
jgi:hypothetical protein